MSGQPNYPGFWVFDIDKVEADEVGTPNPSIVVNSGNDFSLKVFIKLQGSGASAGTAPWDNPAPLTQGAKIVHYALNLNTCGAQELPYRIPSGAPSLVTGEYVVETGPYTTGAGMDLEVGTYQITTNIRHTSPDLAAIQAAFFVTYLMVI